MKKKVVEVYIDGNRKSAELVDENVKSYGMFMHSLVLSNTISGDPASALKSSIAKDENEMAITRYTYGKGFNKKLLDTIAPKMEEIIINPETDLRPSIHHINEKYRVIAKGSPIELIQRCTYVLMDTKCVRLTRRVMNDIQEVFWGMVSKGLKVYALAIRDLSDLGTLTKREAAATEMAFVALVGIG